MLHYLLFQIIKSIFDHITLSKRVKPNIQEIQYL